MNRRAFLKAIGSTALGSALLSIWPRRLFASANARRLRPSDPGWPSPSAWKQLNDAVCGNLIPVNSPLSAEADAGKLLSGNDIKNPYYIGDQPGLTQTLGWIDAWATKPSV